MLASLHGDRQSLVATAAASSATGGERAEDEKVAAFLRQTQRHGRDESNAPAVGDVKASLDDLKTGLLSYYSTLYSMAGRSVDERLQQLSSGGLRHSEFPSPESILDLPGGTTSNNRSERKSLLESLPPPSSYENPVELQIRSNADHASGRGRKAAAPSGSASNVGTTDSVFPSRALDVDGLEGDPSNFYGMLQLPGEAPSTDMAGALNLLGDDMRSAAARKRSANDGMGGQIHDMLTDIQMKCDAMDRRLVTASEALQHEVANPTLREWEYNTLPSLRRKPVLGNREELRRHMITLYTNLYCRSQSNQRQINALQSKIRVLQMHTKGNMARLREDPRLGF